MATSVPRTSGSRNPGPNFADLVASVGLDLIGLAHETGLGLVTLYALRGGRTTARRSTLLSVSRALEAARVARQRGGRAITPDAVLAAVRASRLARAQAGKGAA